MPQSLSKILVHVTFSTKHRDPIIDFEIEDELWAILGQQINKNGSQVLQVGGYLDHVHILLDLARTNSISNLIGPTKANSSSLMKRKDVRYKDFFWQDGYSVFSVNPKNINSVIDYIQNQKEHHTSLTYQEECRRFFDQYGVEYDEKYCWD